MVAASERSEPAMLAVPHRVREPVRMLLLLVETEFRAFDVCLGRRFAQ